MSKCTVCDDDDLHCNYCRKENTEVSESALSDLLCDFNTMKSALKEIARGQEPMDYGKPMVTIERLQQIAIGVLENLGT